MRSRSQIRHWVMAISALYLVTPHSSAVPNDCPALSSFETPNWKEAFPGIDTASLKLASPNIRDMTLLRIDPTKYRFRVFDMRDLAKRKQAQGSYTPPLYSLAELRGLIPNATIVSSAGFTRSLTNPDPAGYVKVNGLERAPVARRDRVLDGVVCFSAVGAPSIESADDKEGRKASAPPGKCVDGFQAGPVVLAQSQVVIDSHQKQASRVVVGVDTGGRLILGYSSMATTAALGCVLSATQLKVTDAINVQGDEIGGISVAPSVSGILPVGQFGSVDSTIASALVVQPVLTIRRQSQQSTNAVSR